MTWDIISTKSEEEFFEEYVHEVLAQAPAELPPAHLKIGNTEVAWFQPEPGTAIINTASGTIEDRLLAETVVREQLRGHNIKQAQFNFDGSEELRKTASWDDIAAKAKRLIQSGNVQLLRNGYNNIVAQVQGDHGTYQSEIGRDDPDSRSITTWQCECEWDQYAWQRSRKWKKFEGRPCSHVLSAFWSSLAAPLDEDAHPEQQQLLNAPAGPAPPASPAPLPTPGAPPPQGEQLQIPGMTPMQPPPEGPNVLPQFPMDPALQPQVNPVSMPGQKPPSPLNPIQYPGGTFSSWNFDGHNTSANISIVSAPPKNPVNGDMVSAKYDDWGTWQGRSDEHGAGSNAKVPAGSVGEVLGTDPTTGMINVLFTGKQSEQKGEMEPWGITAWFLPSELNARPDVRKPGPAVRRRK